MTFDKSIYLRRLDRLQARLAAEVGEIVSRFPAVKRAAFETVQEARELASHAIPSGQSV